MKLSKDKRKELMAKKPKSADERANNEIHKASQLSARMAKKHLKPKRIRQFDPDEPEAPKKKQKKQNKSSFEQELTSTSLKSLKKFRSGPSYKERQELGMTKKGGKGRGGPSKGKGNNSRYKRR